MGGVRAFHDAAALVRQMPESHLNCPASIPWLDGLALGPALVRGDWLQCSQPYQEDRAEVVAWLAGLPAREYARLLAADVCKVLH
ncbi:MAG: hypothetical protein JNM64_09185 [Chloroflexia bacterium]|nr:hypothetical protein [Chloroflexia bacterium]